MDTELTRQVACDRPYREMTPRVKELFERIQKRKYQRQLAFGGNLSVLNDRTKAYDVGYRRSLASELVIRNMPVAIEEGDLLVGNCVQDQKIVRCMLPRYLLAEEAGKESLRLSHKCPNYAKLLSHGLLGMIDEVVCEQRDNGDPDWEQLAEGMKREAYAVIGLAQRYAELAQRMAEEETDATRAAELRKIAGVCRQVPAYPARTFHEALQSIWFINHAFRETEAALSIGCIDRLVAPYFERDLREERLTAESAQELVDCFCLRVNDRAQMDPANYVVDPTQIEGLTQQAQLCYDTGFVTKAENDEADAINHWGQNILISGILPDHTDATSPVTYMFLNTHEKFQMTSPVLTVRVHGGSPQMLLTRVAEVLRHGGGMPYINNDDVLVPAYEALGVSFEDACNYANSNCWETLLQGTCSQEMIRGINFLYYLELTLNNGKSFLYARQVAEAKPIDREDPTTWPAYVCIGNQQTDGVDTGDAADFSTFEELMRAWKTQLDYMLKETMRKMTEVVRTEGNMGPHTLMPLASLLQEDCVRNHRDLTHMGARYNLWHMMAEAVSNAADAAWAIRKYVYEEKRLTLPQLVDCLRHNWAVPNGETIRKWMLYDAEKFGNDVDGVDQIAVEMVDYFTAKVAEHAKEYPDFIFPPCIGTFSWIINIGKRIGASADGRGEQEAIAANMSPVPGRDLSGPTAALNSYLKLNLSAMAAGAPIDLRISSNGLEDEAGLQRIVGLLLAFIRRGGNMMTLTVTSIEELKRAIENPQDYSGLRVRMGGWSAYFTMLSKESQKIHLKRVEHGL